MSLRVAALGFWRQSNLRVVEGIAHLHLRQVQVSGEEQVRPRKDIVLDWSEETYIFMDC